MRRRRRRFRNRRTQVRQGVSIHKKTPLAVVQLLAMIQGVNNSTVRLLSAGAMLRCGKCLRVGHGYVISRNKQDLGHIVIRPGLRFEALPAVDLPGVSGRFLSSWRVLTKAEPRRVSVLALAEEIGFRPDAEGATAPETLRQTDRRA